MAAGASPARGEQARWRQVALLSTSAAVGGSASTTVGLAAAFAGLDHPAAALAVLDRAGADGAVDPWSHWWRAMTAGQGGDMEALDLARAEAARALGDDPDSREVGRRLADLDLELAALRGEPAGDEARFAVLGHRARPERRMLLGGRSSAVYVVDPGWDAVRLVRLGPSEGPAVGNRALLAPVEMIAAVRRGDSGPGWTVPADVPPRLDPADMLAALKENTGARDRRLVALAQEVAEERERLREERERLLEEREELELELARSRRRRERAVTPDAAPTATAAAVAVPRTASEALALLGLAAGAAPGEVERAWRDQVVRCHPDRVVDLHPAIRGQAEGLTIALNAARDLLLGAPVPRSRR